MNLHRWILAACLLVPTAGAAEQPADCAPLDEAGAAALFERWNASLQTLEPGKVVANYAPEALLLPTLANQPRTTHAEIEDYFEHFLAKRPQGEITERTLSVGCNVAWDAGIYVFTLTSEDGAPMRVPARYTFIYGYDPAAGTWLIVHHHSSAMPIPTH